MNVDKHQVAANFQAKLQTWPYESTRACYRPNIHSLQPWTEFNSKTSCSKTHIRLIMLYVYNETWSFMTSPHAGAPTSPVPTVLSFLSNEPTFRGFS